MKIHDDHMNHGAALIQIAEHPQFTAINSFKLKDKTSRSAYRINDDIGVYLKYATRPHPSSPHKEYVFTFTKEHLGELEEISTNVNRVWLALVCVKAREICSLSHGALEGLVFQRTDAKGAAEEQYQIMVTAPTGKSFRVFMSISQARRM